MLILTTGGTIVSADTDTGLRPLISSEQLRGYLGDLDRYFSFDIQSVMPVPKALMTLAVPTVISQLILLLYNLADTYFIGRTGNPYM